MVFPASSLLKRLVFKTSFTAINPILVGGTRFYSLEERKSWSSSSFNSNSSSSRPERSGFSSSSSSRHGNNNRENNDMLNFKDIVGRLSSIPMPDAQRSIVYHLRSSLKGFPRRQLAFFRLLEAEIPQVLEPNHYNMVINSLAENRLSKPVILAILNNDGHAWSLEKVRTDMALNLDVLEKEFLRYAGDMLDRKIQIYESVYRIVLRQLVIKNDSISELELTFDNLAKILPNRDSRFFDGVRRDLLFRTSLGPNPSETLPAYLRFLQFTAQKQPDIHHHLMLEAMTRLNRLGFFPEFCHFYQETFGEFKIENTLFVRRLASLLAENGKAAEGQAILDQIKADVSTPDRLLEKASDDLNEKAAYYEYINGDEGSFKSAFSKISSNNYLIRSILRELVGKTWSKEFRKNILTMVAENDNSISAEWSNLVVLMERSNPDPFDVEVMEHYLSLVKSHESQKFAVDENVELFLNVLMTPIMETPLNKYSQRFNVTRRAVKELAPYLTQKNVRLLGECLDSSLSNFPQIRNSSVRASAFVWLDELLRKFAEVVNKNPEYMTRKLRSDLLNSARKNGLTKSLTENLLQKIGGDSGAAVFSQNEDSTAANESEFLEVESNEDGAAVSKLAEADIASTLWSLRDEFLGSRRYRQHVGTSAATSSEPLSESN